MLIATFLATLLAVGLVITIVLAVWFLSIKPRLDTRIRTARRRLDAHAPARVFFSKEALAQIWARQDAITDALQAPEVAALRDLL
jgi:hypothetical protein